MPRLESTTSGGFCLKLFRVWIASSNPIMLGFVVYLFFFHNVVDQADLFNKDVNVDYNSLPRVNSNSGPELKPMNFPLRPTQWKSFSKKAIKLPHPIVVTSLPKSGTTSIWKYFVCGGQEASHGWITRNSPVKKAKRGTKRWVAKTSTTKPELAGMCIHDNIKRGRPPFHNCGEYDVFTDSGVRYLSAFSDKLCFEEFYPHFESLVLIICCQYINYRPDYGLECFFPGVDGLEAIYRSYPNATLVNVVRDTEGWYNSLKKWSHSSLFIRFRMCNATNFLTGQSTREDFYRFYEWHTEMVRQFTAERPSLTYVEVKLEDDVHTPKILEERTGISQSCWRHCRPQEKDCYMSDEDEKVDEDPVWTANHKLRSRVASAV